MKMNKPILTGLLCAALLVPVSAYAAPPRPIHPAADRSGSAEQFSTVKELMQQTGLSQTVGTTGHMSAGDGAGMTYSVVPTRPSGTSAKAAVPLGDGKWAVPSGMWSAPHSSADGAAVEDMVNRARSFVKAGKSLVWDSKRATPLSGKNIHKMMSKPYALTCSSFVGMVLQGWDYAHTTYAADKNTRVGRWVNFEKPSHAADLWQAHKLARWFHSKGDLWLNKDGTAYQRGDILFFSKQNPEGKGTTGTYFGNIYHVGIYLGGGRIVHSYGPTSETGVVEQRLADSLRADIAFVARPRWNK